MSTDHQIALTRFLDWARLKLDPSEVNGWEVFTHHVAGELAAVAILKGTEIHFALAPQWRKRLIHRGRVRSFLAPMFERYGFLTTKSDLRNAASERFLTRMGFEETWFDGQYQNWMLSALPFGKEKV